MIVCTGQDETGVSRIEGRKRGPTFDDAENSGPAPRGHGASRKPALADSHYTVAIICPLPLEKAAAVAMLDEEHQPPRFRRADDHNTYTLGSMHTEQGTHHVVIVGMGKDDIGILPASTVAQNLKQSFPKANVCLVVGTAGGVPSRSHPLYLGDVVVGTEVMHYDPQRVLQDAVIRTGKSSRPPPFLRSAVSYLETMHEKSGSRTAQILEQRLQHLQRYLRPSLEDRLFDVDCIHFVEAADDSEDDPASDPCKGCDSGKIKRRRQSHSADPTIYHGRIGSGHTLLRSSEVRESLGSRELDVLCFEMETAGIVERLACITIRGIADYADSHKNKRWQRYAAATAAAYARELLECITPISLSEERELKIWANPHMECLSVPLERRQDQFLEFLRFDRMDQRRQGIDSPHTSTCEWLLKEPNVVKWLDDAQFREHNGLLLLTGNAGTGKSTCVNYLFDWHKRQRLPGAAAPVFASFFFHNRGVELERSVIGMYRALLLQLFTGYSDLLSLLDQFSFRDVGAVVGQCPPLATMKHLFREGLLSLNGRSFVCYVDALDEGNVRDVREMAAFFQKMATDPAVNRTGSFRIMFSSRPYPVVTNQWPGVKFVLEKASGHRHGLEKYVLHHLADAEPIIIETILQKASGVFLWVKLVARMFFDEYLSQGLPCDLERLRNTPDELQDLFQDMLERDKSNLAEFALAMTWILYGRWPWDVTEFCAALDLGMEVQQAGSFVSSKITIRNDTMLRKRVASASRGFAEVIDSNYGTASVQLIHESAQELLMNGGLDHVLRASDFQSPTICHGQLAYYCLCHLRDPMVLEWLGAAEQRDPSNWRCDRGKHPFTDYALAHVLYHADRSESYIPHGFIRDFPKAAKTAVMNVGNFADSLRNWSMINECARSYPALFKYGDWTEHRQGVHLDSQDATFDSPLHDASRGGHLSVVQILVEWGADMDLCSIHDSHRTALMVAIEEDHKSVAEWLITRGANIHVVDSDGKTALHLAARLDCVQVIAQLLAKGAVLNQQDKEGRTPLMTAVNNHHPRAARTLISAGATLTKPYGLKEMELLFAVVSGDAESCRGLVRAGADKEIRDWDGDTPLLIAARIGSHAVCQILVKLGADLEARNKFGDTPLVIAALHGQDAICQFLVSAGAHLEARDYMGRTPLLIAAECGRDVICQILLNAGADKDAQDCRGGTALRIATYWGMAKTAQLLINCGADVNIPADNGETCLMRAARTYHMDDIVILLLANGADLHVRNNKGKTALDVATDDAREILRKWPHHKAVVSSPRSLDKTKATHDGSARIRYKAHL